MEGITIDAKRKNVQGTKDLIVVIGIVIVLLIGLFSWIAYGVQNNRLEVLDRVVYNYISGIKGNGMTRAMIFISFLGGANFLIFLSLMFFYIFKKVKKGYWDPLFVMMNLSGAWLLNGLLKAVFQRQRPSLDHLAKATGYSFPSGHSMIGFAFYGFMAYMVYMNIKHSKTRWILMTTMTLLAFAIGISRIYLGVHYPSDVLGGFLGGAAWMGLCIGFHQWGLSFRHQY